MAYSTGIYGYGHFVPGVFDSGVLPTILPAEDVTIPILDHDLYAQARLLEQYKQSNVKSLLSGLFGRQIQDIENAMQGVFYRMGIDSAAQELLDFIGGVIGQIRPDLAADDDGLYRYLIRARIAENISNGTIENLLTIWRLITGNQDVEIIENYPGEAVFVTATPVDELFVNVVFQALQRVSAAGVPVGYIHVYEPIGAFGFEDSGLDTEGFGDATDLDAGGMASYIQISL